jgi:hypothetical protein
LFHIRLLLVPLHVVVVWSALEAFDVSALLEGSVLVASLTQQRSWLSGIVIVIEGISRPA